jgi:hypothetical protein
MQRSVAIPTGMRTRMRFCSNRRNNAKTQRTTSEDKFKAPRSVCMQKNTFFVLYKRWCSGNLVVQYPQHQPRSRLCRSGQGNGGRWADLHMQARVLVDVRALGRQASRRVRSRLHSSARCAAARGRQVGRASGGQKPATETQISRFCFVPTGFISEPFGFEKCVLSPIPHHPLARKASILKNNLQNLVGIELLP